MKKEFSNMQLFSLTDGRLSTKMDDVYIMLNHIFDEDFTTIALPLAFNKLNELNPDWFKEAKQDLINIGIDKSTEFQKCINLLKLNPKFYQVPQIEIYN